MRLLHLDYITREKYYIIKILLKLKYYYYIIIFKKSNFVFFNEKKNIFLHLSKYNHIRRKIIHMLYNSHFPRFFKIIILRYARLSTLHFNTN